jgi:nucleotide-binding universal stress UspA family protein
MLMAFDVHSTPSARQATVPRRILLCYDGSAEAKHALERVGEIVAVVPSRVTVVSVADPIYPDPPYTRFADPGEEQTHRRLLEEAAEDLRRDGADLVVLGSRHRGLIKRVLFGSVSAEVVVKAPCDVLVVR